MRIKGIIFDKDGTLIDFYSLWLQAADHVIPELIEALELENTEDMRQYLLTTIGVVDGIVDPNGGLSYKSYGEIAKDIRQALLIRDKTVEADMVQELLTERFDAFATSDHIEFKTFTHMDTMLQQLRELGIRIGLATADTLRSARACLEKLNIIELFDFVGGDDGVVQPKPDPEMFYQFVNEFNLMPKEVLVVGDTPNDMFFAKQCGATAVGVLSGVSCKEDLLENGDYIISSVDELLTLIGRI